MQGIRSYAPFVAAMAIVVIASNYLVQFPIHATIAGFNLADLFTWGAFAYPIAFLVTDLTNRRFGARVARGVVVVGFLIAVTLSFLLASPRIAIASGSAFLIAQLLDVSIFDRLRHQRWWKAPLISSVVGSLVDTAIFFSMAFAASFTFLGANDDFAISLAPLLGMAALEAPRWVSWALGDLGVKLAVGTVMLIPYGVLITVVKPKASVDGFTQRA
ncbi:VUT family protein [Pararhizobium haloflavum]|uniref:VUT family protein n=1 Tax=Pararhizobium haloflavum TaxID=2037914 RepID=UPI000C176267|nr:VUT family protein [Pararhizobium haloflavum]